MFTEIAVLVAGVLPGRLLRNNKHVIKAVGRVTLLTIYAMLFVLGAKLGGDEALLSALGQLGFKALVIGFLSTVGSAAAVRLTQKFFRREARDGGPEKQEGQDESGQKGQLAKGLMGSLYILFFFCLGLGLARAGFLPVWLITGNLSLYTLWVMLFFIGMGIGFDLSALRIVRDMGFRVALVPLLAIAGTALGCGLAFIVLPDIGLAESLTVGAGFGYYSLSSVVVSEMASPALGSITLLANVFRELFTLLAAPALVRLFGPLAPVGAAGAPAMDTCLPVIVFFSGERYGIVALFSGLVFTMLVPILVPLMLKL